MLRPTFALFVRALQEDNRRIIPYIARLLLIITVLGFLAGIHVSSMFATGAPGREFFAAVIYINLLFVTIVGLFLFATALTEEKEEMTMGLLRMTRISPLSLILGKSTSRLLSTSLLILAQLPFTLLAISLGGVSQGQIFAAYASLLAFVFFLANFCLLFSTVFRSSSFAIWASCAGLFLLALSPAIVGGLVPWLLGPDLLSWIGPTSTATATLERVSSEFLWPFNPISRLSDILTTGFAGNPDCFQVRANLIAGLALFLVSWAAFNSFNRYQKEPGGTSSSSRLRLVRPGRTWRSAPIIWKDAFFLHGGPAGNLAQLALIAAAAAMILLPGALSWGLDLEDVGWGLFASASLVGVPWLGLAAGRAFNAEFRLRTLSSLALLPLSTASLLRQKMIPIFLSAIPSYLVLITGFVFVTVDSAYHPFDEPEFWGAAIWFGTVILFFMLVTAILSLFWRWGAFPVALLATGAFHGLGMMFYALSTRSSSSSALFAPPILMNLVWLALLVFLLYQRLDRMPAQED
jgi:ABC-type transport system involved in multi-copper enzyme maturation permease subunit